jgi:hypothetical protein
MAQALINGEEYNYAMIRVNVFGFTIEGISSIEYNKKIDITGNKGRGRKIVSFSKGNEECTGKMKLALKETLRIMAAAKAKFGAKADLLSLSPFDIEVVYVPDDTTNKIVTDKLLGCLFKDDGRSASTGDPQFEHDYELFVADIEYDV